MYFTLPANWIEVTPEVFEAALANFAHAYRDPVSEFYKFRRFPGTDDPPITIGTRFSDGTCLLAPEFAPKS